MTEEELRELDALTEDWRGTSGEVQLGDAVRRLIAEVRRLRGTKSMQLTGYRIESDCYINGVFIKAGTIIEAPSAPSSATQSA